MPISLKGNISASTSLATTGWGKIYGDINEQEDLITLVNNTDTQIRQDIQEELNTKVDKIEGSSLMTTEEHTKLASLFNYDDSELRRQIAEEYERALSAEATKVDKEANKSLMSADEHNKLASLFNYDDTNVRQLIANEVADREESYQILDDKKMEYFEVHVNGSNIVDKSGNVMTYTALKQKFDDPATFLYMKHTNLIFIPSIDVNNSGLAFSVAWTRKENEIDTPFINRVMINQQNVVNQNQLQMENIDWKFDEMDAEDEQDVSLIRNAYPSWYAHKALRDNLTGRLDAVEPVLSENTRINTEQNHRIRNLEEASKGNLYYLDEQTEDKYIRDVPSNALPNQPLTMIGGKTVKSKNLFPTDFDLGSNHYTNNGDGTISVNSSDGDVWSTKVINYYLLLNSGTYTLSCDGNTRIQVGDINGMINASVTNYISFNITESKKVSFKFLAQTGIDYPFTISNIQLEAGNTKTPFEPYFDGLKSASVDDVISHGVNLWDEEWELGYYSAGSGSYITSTSNVCSKRNSIIPAEPNTQYKFIVSASEYTAYTALLFYSENGYIGYKQVTRGETFITPNGARYIRFYNNSTYGTTYNHDIAIVKGTSGTYSPYFEKHKPLPSAIQDLDGYGIGINENCYNYLEKSGEKWLWHKMCKKYVIPQNIVVLSWGNTGFSGHFGGVIETDIETNGNLFNSNSISSRGYVVNYANDNMTIYKYPNNSRVAIINDSYQTRDSWLQNIIGIEIVYPLENEQIEDVTEILKDFDNYIEVEPNGTIEMHNTNDMAIDVPSTIAYGLKVEV